MVISTWESDYFGFFELWNEQSIAYRLHPAGHLSVQFYELILLFTFSNCFKKIKRRTIWYMKVTWNLNIRHDHYNWNTVVSVLPVVSGLLQGRVEQLTDREDHKRQDFHFTLAHATDQRKFMVGPHVVLNVMTSLGLLHLFPFWWWKGMSFLKLEKTRENGFLVVNFNDTVECDYSVVESDGEHCVHHARLLYCAK